MCASRRWSPGRDNDEVPMSQGDDAFYDIREPGAREQRRKIVCLPFAEPLRCMAARTGCHESLEQDQATTWCENTKRLLKTAAPILPVVHGLEGPDYGRAR